MPRAAVERSVRDIRRVLDLLEHPPKTQCATPHRRPGVAEGDVTLPPWREEATSKEHRRDSFDCGDDDLNAWLRRFARQSHELGGARTFLAVPAEDRRTILGFYTLSPASVA